MVPTGEVDPAKITPEWLYHSRRQFLKAAGFLGASALLAAACGREEPITVPGEAQSLTPGARAAGKVDELGDQANTYEDITQYNNYYEFTTDKAGVAGLSKGFATSPWTVEVSGLVKKPTTFTIEDLLKFPQQERIYRLRCVEAWSMVIPWQGFPLNLVLQQVEPLPEAKFVRFETLLDADQMPGQKSRLYPWPYQEGLRLDEAMHDLTILATGMYGKPVLAQNGAPIRLVVPWKYGFKSIKSMIKIELVQDQPGTFWSTIAPEEYGFYSNVNPEVDHPRWSQATERRIGETGRRKTMMFNGYAEQVASLYKGMDLRANY